MHDYRYYMIVISIALTQARNTSITQHTDAKSCKTSQMLETWRKIYQYQRCYETPHRPHRRQIQVLGIGKMCLVRCILLISIKKRNRLRFSCISIFWLACCYSCCLFSVRYRCIGGRCGRCGVSWHPNISWGDHGTVCLDTHHGPETANMAHYINGNELSSKNVPKRYMHAFTSSVRMRARSHFFWATLQ